MTTLSSAAQRYLAHAPPTLDLDWRDARYCVLDVETTGLDTARDEIISYAAIPIDDGRIILADACQGLVRPSRPISTDAIRVHGIRPTDVAAAPPLPEVLDELLGALTGRLLVVHVDWVERGFLARPLRSRGVRLLEPVLDTARLARAALGTPRNEDLYALGRRLGLPLYGVHDAFGDALTTAQVFLALAHRLEPQVGDTAADLCRAGAARRRRRLWRR